MTETNNSRNKFSISSEELRETIDSAVFSAVKSNYPCNISDVSRATGLTHFETSKSVKRLAEAGKVDIREYAKFKIISLTGGKT